MKYFVKWNELFHNYKFRLFQTQISVVVEYNSLYTVFFNLYRVWSLITNVVWITMVQVWTRITLKENKL